jgi:hypothetical protein
MDLKRIIREEMDRPGNLTVEKGKWDGSWELYYDGGLKFRGSALIFDKNNTLKDTPKLKDDEMYLFKIQTSPVNKGVGRMFLREIFKHFNINRIYLPSEDANHPVWSKIATKIGRVSFGMTLFMLDRDQFLKEKIVEEQDDFNWVNDTPELHGFSFKAGGFDRPIYTITDKGERYHVDVTWLNVANGKTEDTTYKRSVVMKLFKDGTWVPVI